jgi:hypothetical protein
MNHLSDLELSAILDGEERDERGHLRLCARCRGELEALGRLERLLRAPRRLRWKGAAAAAVLLALLWMQAPPPAPAPAEARRAPVQEEEVDLLAPSPYDDPNDDWAEALEAAAQQPGYREFVRRELPRADLMKLLTSADPELQSDAVVLISKTRNPRFDVVELIQLMDAPALREPLMRVLPKLTGRDFGSDAGLWKAHLRSMAGQRT